MVKFKLTCPDCGAAIITQSPKAIVWELCPSCRRHVWDAYDVLMADTCIPERSHSGVGNLHANN